VSYSQVSKQGIQSCGFRGLRVYFMRLMCFNHFGFDIHTNNVKMLLPTNIQLKAFIITLWQTIACIILNLKLSLIMYKLHCHILMLVFNLTFLNRIYTRKLKHAGLSMRPNFVACPATNLLSHVLNYI